MRRRPERDATHGGSFWELESTPRDLPMTIKEPTRTWGVASANDGSRPAARGDDRRGGPVRPFAF